MKIISEFSPWVIAPMVIISIVLSIYFYKKTDWIDKKNQWKKWLLISLRSTSLFLIFILLLGLTLQYTETKEEKPVFLVLIDNSMSMKNYKDSSLVYSQVTSLINTLKSTYGNFFDYDVITCGSGIGNNNFNFIEKKSNIEEGFQFVNSQYYNRNISGIAFISDGNYNVGSSPIYAAEKINLTPIFSLAVGDTIPKRDQLIKNVSANNIAFLSDFFPVEVDISSIKFQGKSVRVSVSHEGKLLTSKDLTYGKENFDYQQVKFNVPATKIGFQQYTIDLSPLDGEYTLKNNKKSFYIEVMDSRSKVLILSQAPHPDISALKQALETNEKLEIFTKTFSSWDKKLEKVDLVVVHEPGLNFSSELLNEFVNKGIPQLYIIGPNSTSSAVNSLGLGISYEISNQLDEVQGSLNTSFKAFELSDGIKEAINYFPPLKSKFGKLNTGGNIEAIIFQRIGQVVKSEPLVFFKQQKQIKNGYINGEGIWQWRLNEYLRSSSHIHFNELISKIANYLMIKQEGMGLRVTLNKRFTIEDPVIFNASFYNASLEPITSPSISLTLISEQGKKYVSQFGSNGIGYQLDFGKLSAGKYSWEAQCVFNGKKYTKSGVFLVENIDLEKLETTANHDVMKQLSNQSDGKFYYLKDYEKFVKELNSREDMVVITREELRFQDLIHLVPLLILLALLFSIEWFIRRFSGAY